MAEDRVCVQSQLLMDTFIVDAERPQVHTKTFDRELIRIFTHTSNQISSNHVYAKLNELFYAVCS